MKKELFHEYCRNRFLVLDGATGSNLMKAGMPIGVCPEHWILEHPEALIALQKAYVAAGSNIIYAPTFTANRVKLKEHGLYNQQEQMIKGLVALSKEAAEDKALVAGDLTMTGKQLAPIGSMKTEELIDIYKEQITLMEKAGVDLFIIETMMSLAETRAAVIAAKEVSQLPIMVTMSFEQNGKTLFGTDAKTAAIVLDGLGVDALGVNCSTGPADMAKVVREIASVTSLPLIAKPNAGLPKMLPDGTTGYDMSPEVFAEEAKQLLDAGATIFGGCCGTDPRYIEALRKMLESYTNQNPKNRDFSDEYLASERYSVLYTVANEKTRLSFGTAINPAENEELAEELKEGYTDTLLELVQDQEEDEVDIININLHADGVDETAMMVQVLEELQTMTNRPLSFTYTGTEVLKAALRNYPGRALVFAENLCNTEFMDVSALTEKYGAVICYNHKL